MLEKTTRNLTVGVERRYWLPAMVTVVAAPWGNPFQWRPANYTYTCSGKTVSTTSRTSLEPVTKCHVQIDGETYVVVVVADTLAAAQPPQCCNASGILQQLPLLQNKQYQSYNSLVDDVRKAVEEWIRQCSGASTLATLLQSNRLRIEVVPGLGSYSGWQFSPTPSGAPGPIQNYVAEVLHILVKALDEAEKTYGKPVEKLVVDLTHGINYMPAGFRQAAAKAVELYAAAHTDTEIKLVHVNSEPIPPGRPCQNQQTPSVNIHVVEEVVAESRSAADTVAYELDQQARRRKGGLKLSLAKLNKTMLSQDQAQTLGKQISNILRSNNPCANTQNVAINGVAAARIHLYSMILATAYIAVEVSQCNTLQNIINVVEKLRTLRNNTTQVNAATKTITHVVMLDPTDIQIAYHAASLLHRLGKLAHKLELPQPSAKLEKDGVDLNKLEQIAQHLGILYEVIAKNELNKAREDCLKACKCPYPVSTDWPNACCDISSIDPRNLRAHAGLEKNIVEAKIENNTLKLRYRVKGKNCWQKLKQQLSKPSF